jgi:hypothetical protein
LVATTDCERNSVSQIGQVSSMRLSVVMRAGGRVTSESLGTLIAGVEWVFHTLPGASLYGPLFTAIFSRLVRRIALVCHALMAVAREVMHDRAGPPCPGR